MAGIAHKTVHDYIPLAKAMTADMFADRYAHPFLFGKEVLEEEFRFSTLVTDEKGATVPPREPQQDALKVVTGPGGLLPGARGTDTFRIRHWVIAVKKPTGSPSPDRIFMGRGESNDICVPHKTVSKLHGYFQRDPQITTRWFVVDTGSANGTKHNGMRIPPRAKVALVDADTIVFGRCVFQWMSARALYERLIAMAPIEAEER